MNNRFEEEIRNALKRTTQSPEPFPGHEERFENKLLRLDKPKPTRWLKWYYLVPAAAILVGAIITVVWMELHPHEQLAAVPLSEVSYEMARVEKFYSERINEKTPIADASDPVLAGLMKDLTRLEDDYNKLKLALGRDIENPKVIDAMIANYKYRLQIIEMMQQYIQLQNNKNQHNENAL